MNQEKSTPQIAYEAYGQSRDWRTYDGKPMPQWNELPPEIVTAWEAASNAIVKVVIESFITSAKELVMKLNSRGSS